MGETAARPDYVTSFKKPAGTEIKKINGHYYLYERKSVYDPVRKRKVKKSGSMLGTITPEGFVEKKARISPADASEIVCKEYGSSAYLLSVANETGMSERLRKTFPDSWRSLLSISILIAQHRCPLKRIGHLYSLSCLSETFGDLPLSPASLTGLLKETGTARGSIVSYMKEDLEGAIVMFDGHRIISSSDLDGDARLGYDSRRRYSPQINLVYMFRSDGVRLPVYYKQFTGDVPDVTAFSDILTDSGMKEAGVTLVADKGFGSADNYAAVTDSGLSYIIPLRRGSSDIPEIPASWSGYETCFVFRGRSVFTRTVHHDGYDVHLFYDMHLANDESCDFIKRKEKSNAAVLVRKEAEEKRRARGKGKLGDSEFAALEPVDVKDSLSERVSLGTFAIRTNRTDLDAVQVYSIYKTRQDIEQCFKVFGDILDRDATYMRSHESMEAYLFISHLAMQLYYKAVDEIAARGLSDRYSFDDLVSYLGSIRMNRLDGKWYTTKMTKQTRKLMEDLEIEIEALSGVRKLSGEP